MLLAIIIYTIKRLIKSAYSIPRIRVTRVMVILLFIIIPLLLASSSGISTNHTEIHIYDVIKSDKKIGFIHIEKQLSGIKTTYNISCEINTKLIFNFKAVSKERILFNQDTLTESSIYRKLNNKVKVNEKLSYKNGGYYLFKDDKEKLVTQKIIRWNLIRLYFEEPKNVSKVYCDRYKEYRDLVDLGMGRYRIVFPNQSSNIFYYQSGSCVQVDAEGSFYRVKLLKRSIEPIMK